MSKGVLRLKVLAKVQAAAKLRTGCDVSGVLPSGPRFTLKTPMRQDVLGTPSRKRKADQDPSEPLGTLCKSFDNCRLGATAESDYGLKFGDILSNVDGSMKKLAIGDPPCSDLASFGRKRPKNKVFSFLSNYNALLKIDNKDDLQPNPCKDVPASNTIATHKALKHAAVHHEVSPTDVDDKPQPPPRALPVEPSASFDKPEDQVQVEPQKPSDVFDKPKAQVQVQPQISSDVFDKPEAPVQVHSQKPSDVFDKPKAQVPVLKPPKNEAKVKVKKSWTKSTRKSKPKMFLDSIDSGRKQLLLRDCFAAASASKPGDQC